MFEMLLGGAAAWVLAACAVTAGIVGAWTLRALWQGAEDAFQRLQWWLGF